MSANESDLDSLRKELIYYKHKTDELAGENLKLDYTVSGLRHELKQKRAGFNLLSLLPESIGSLQDLKEILRIAGSAINSNLGMDKTIVLMPSAKPGVYVPSVALGMGLVEASLVQEEFEIPLEITQGLSVAIINKKAEKNDLHKKIERLFGLPFFIMSAVLSDAATLAVIISGRTLEAKPLYPPLDQGDADTFVAIGNLISATIESIKVVSMKENDRLKTEFFANISHEFRTPITLTIGPLESLIAGKYGDVNPRILKETELILRNQRRLLDLINQILDLAKMESGEMKLKYQNLKNINSFINDRVEQFHAIAEKRDIELVTDFAVGANDCDFYGDSEKLDKVVFNLLSNAIKFTPKGKITVRTEIKSSDFIISVKDSGIGIKEDQIAQIFDRFKQADSSQSREYAGTGIGLALVKQIVDLHKGKVSVTSVFGQGTTFEIELPLGKNHFDESLIVESDPQSRKENISQAYDVREGKGTANQVAEVQEINQKTIQELNNSLPKILYVDDNADLRRFVHGLLKSEFNVFLAINGLDGFEKAKEFDVDLVLSDLMMPVMTGTELLKTLRSDSKTETLPFVMLTAKHGSETRIEELQNGVDDFLSKPFSEAELVARIRNLLKIRQQQRMIKKDLQAARQIQYSLLPLFDQAIEKVKLQFYYKPSEDLSGDFFDTLRMGDRLYFYLADVTSHGTASAQVTLILKAIFKNLSVNFTDKTTASEIVKLIAKQYIDYQLDYSIGMAFGAINLTENTVELVGSNFPNPVLVVDGAFEEISFPTNPAIDGTSGRDSNFEFNSITVPLRTDVKIYFFSDGVFEFTNKKTNSEFGYRSFARLLRGLKQDDWRTELMNSISGLNGGVRFDDDLSVMQLTLV